MVDSYSLWKGWKVTDFGQHSANDHRYFSWHLERALGQPGTALDVLEIGYGNGKFMGWLRSRGHRVVGVESNPRLVDVAREAGFEACNRMELLDANARFDLVAAFDVIEHVPMSEVEDFFRGLAGKLKAGGRLLLRFPNGESPFGLWMQQGDITHVHALGLSKIRQLCAACNLTLEHSGEALPWRRHLPGRRLGACFAHVSRRVFEWQLRKMYNLPRGLDLSTNQLVVLSLAPQRADPVAAR